MNMPSVLQNHRLFPWDTQQNDTPPVALARDIERNDDTLVVRDVSDGRILETRYFQTVSQSSCVKGTVQKQRRKRTLPQEKGLVIVTS